MASASLIKAIPMHEHRVGLKSARGNSEFLSFAESDIASLSVAPDDIYEEVGALQLLRLTFYEAKTYLALVKKGPLKASEIGFLSNIPRPKVYGALSLLERKGLVHVTPSNPQFFRAVSPLAALKAKADELVNQAAFTRRIIQKLAEEHELTKLPCSRFEIPREANELWYIDGREHIYNRVAEMLRRATKSISYYATPAGLVRAYKAHAEHLESVAKHGAAVRVLAQTSKDNHAVVQEMAAIVKIRKTTKPLTANFVCIDGRELVVIENSPNDFNVETGADTAAWTTNHLLVQLYENLFERVWENASSV
ncbi:MAG TPA: helix-turn-helix domain-containing protein [Candidatus Acidoferrum sp.]|nr:helix-turn-helix domain-containing protein [Candidatus Acidoferrum sp.]